MFWPVYHRSCSWPHWMHLYKATSSHSPANHPLCERKWCQCWSCPEADSPVWEEMKNIEITVSCIVNTKVFVCAAQQKWSTSIFNLHNTFVELIHNSSTRWCCEKNTTLKQHWSCVHLQLPSRLTHVIYGENKLVKVQAKAKHKGLQTWYASLHPRSPYRNTCREVELILSICVMASIP